MYIMNVIILCMYTRVAYRRGGGGGVALDVVIYTIFVEILLDKTFHQFGKG